MFRYVFLVICIALLIVNTISASSVGDEGQSSQNRSGIIFQFTVRLLRKVKELLYRVKPTNFSSLKDKPVNSSQTINATAFEKSHVTSNDSKSDNKNRSSICPKSTYETVMRRVSPVGDISMEDDEDDASEEQGPFCDPIPMNETIRGIVQLLNHTQLIETKVRRKDSGKQGRQDGSNRKTTNGRSLSDIDIANQTDTKKTYCIMMMVYAHFCPFSKIVAPAYVSLARIFPQIAFYAIHIHDYKRVKSTMSAFGVPKIFLIKNGRTVAVFNKSVKSFETLTTFVHNLTGFTPVLNDTSRNTTDNTENRTSVDYGPFVFHTDEFDVYLLFSWAFILCLIANYFLSSSQGERFRRRVVQLWQEHEHVN